MSEVENDRILQRKDSMRSLRRGALLKTHNCYKQSGRKMYNDESKKTIKNSSQSQLVKQVHSRHA